MGVQDRFQKEFIGCEKQFAKWTEDRSWITGFAQRETSFSVERFCLTGFAWVCKVKDSRPAALVSYHASPLGPWAIQVILVSVKLSTCRTEILLPAVNICKELKWGGYYC